MTPIGGFDHLSTTEQAEIIRSVSTQVAKRQTAYRCMELYALDILFIEISFTRYRGARSVDKIKYINSSDGLQPYLEQITLPINYQ